MLPENILITGPTGLIGSHLTKLLDKEGFKIFTLGRTPVTSLKSVTHIPVDFSNDWETDILPGEIDTIIHLAQSENFRLFPEKASEVFAVNTLSTMKLIDYAVKNKVGRFIYASSAGIYGNSNDGFNEESDIIYNNELGFYLGTKHCSEVILENYMSLLKVIMLRFFFVYGKGQGQDMLIPRLAGFIKNGDAITLQEEDGIRINPIYVDDAVSAIRSAMNLESSYKINVAGPNILSLKEIGNIIGEAIHKPPLFNVEHKKAKHLIGDTQKMSQLLGAPLTSFKEGFNSIANNYKNAE